MFPRGSSIQYGESKLSISFIIKFTLINVLLLFREFRSETLIIIINLFSDDSSEEEDSFIS